MADTLRKSGDELLIVDNSDTDWKVLNYLKEWVDISNSFDVATGTFEIGSLLALDGQWQKLEKLRILLGDEVSKRTRQVLLDGIARGLDTSLEKEKESNDFLTGVPGIVEAMRNRRIECRVYTKGKFHAKAYITHAKQLVVGSAALVGSSNFTKPGLTDNVELNIQLRREVPLLQEWYEEHWNKADDISDDLLRIVERHTKEYSPFDVYAKALYEFFRGHELTTSEWELARPDQGGSRMYKVLDQYQKEGYHALMKIGSQYGGAFLCDGVGLGKTYVGLMIIERLIMHDRKRVALIVPKAAREDVWNRELKRHLGYLCGDFSNLVVFNHTDLLRSGNFQQRLDRVRELADVILIDEAHHFRNTGVKGSEGEYLSRYWRLFDICEGKTVFMLTATPVNNRLIDLQHMIELFSRRRPDYFKDAPLGIQSLQGHFRRLENELERILAEKEGGGNSTDLQTNQVEAEQVLWDDELFRKIVVQRSRAYVKKSQEQHGGTKAIFPERKDPRVVNYQLRKTYGHLLDSVEKAFQKDKPLFSLAVYYPLAYYIGPDMEKQHRSFMENRQKAVVSLIRTLFLKRFESSTKAFEFSCGALFLKLLAWVTKHSKTAAASNRLDRWKRQHEDLIQYVLEGHRELMGDVGERDAEEDIIDDEMLEEIEELSPNEYKVEEILDETFMDLEQIFDFIRELKRFKPAGDDKLKALIKLLKQDKDLAGQKVLVFSEFMATARYLKKQLEEAGFKDVDEVDSGSGRDRSEIIRAFSPYYNQPPEEGLFEGVDKEIRILISTDVLSEGLNLQDATRLVNYDLHWNPVRLMQRIGRVDRRLNTAIEERIIADRPELREIRGTVIFWNFLPPGELDTLLRLYKIVSHKTLRISKIFGIEGKKLLRPEDEYEALKDFSHDYEGTTSTEEAMHLEYQQLLADHPGLEERLSAFPQRLFSGRRHPSPGTRAVFFCYALPAMSAKDREAGSKDLDRWTEEAGFRKWYMYDLATGKIREEPSEMINAIRSMPATPRVLQLEKQTLSEIRGQIDKYIKNSYLKQVQAPMGVKASLKCWMELN